MRPITKSDMTDTAICKHTRERAEATRANLHVQLLDALCSENKVFVLPDLGHLFKGDDIDRTLQRVKQIKTILRLNANITRLRYHAKNGQNVVVSIRHFKPKTTAIPTLHKMLHLCFDLGTKFNDHSTYEAYHSLSIASKPKSELVIFSCMLRITTARELWISYRYGTAHGMHPFSVGSATHKKHSTHVSNVIADALRVNENTSRIHLARNHINPKGASAIAGALHVNTALEDLRLFSNDIGNAGTIAIAKALRENTSLTQLDLSENKIGDLGATALANALKTNSALVILRLGGNKISAKSAEAIAHALRISTVLTTLDLRGNRLDKHGKKKLRNAVKDREGFVLLL